VKEIEAEPGKAEKSEVPVGNEGVNLPKAAHHG
jgi:hypothetical protein